MKYGVLVSALLFIAGILIMLLQLWFSPWSQQVFMKIMITVAAFFVISIVVAFVNKEIKDTRQLKGGDNFKD
jgi:uncharacterized membrane protein YcjF (UPF0283 family)